ncbi:plasmid partition protein ParG [Photobacterium damselae]|uniref:plasmid partition protein ParG n=1 Tax=Photobacterium damselae TaxID=38293 RepID=UPI004067FD05
MKMKLGKHNGINRVLNELQTKKTKKLQMNIDEDLHKQFKLECLKEEKDMTEVVIDLIHQWLSSKQ